jgi:hypothetical protein
MKSEKYLALERSIVSHSDRIESEPYAAREPQGVSEPEALIVTSILSETHLVREPSRKSESSSEESTMVVERATYMESTRLDERAT